MVNKQNNNLPEEIIYAFDNISKYFKNITKTSIERKFSFTKTSANYAKIIPSKNKIVIEYPELNYAFRAIGQVLAGNLTENQPSKLTCPFKNIGIMLDCSRNRVFKIEYLKYILSKLALLGYNQAMLYTEDTLQIPGEEYFGYMRGPYSGDEIHQLDLFANSLGIELVPCVQTLGHFRQVLKWDAYSHIADTESVLLAEHSETYKFLDKMISYYASLFSTEKIHIGMDEAHSLGRGNYLDKKGYKDRFEIFNNHLDKVNRICTKYGLKPMIWSDMYFRIASKKQDYYDLSSQIPDKVKQEIPTTVQLVYWDYYHQDKSFYKQMIKKHREFNSDPVMASGIWTWNRFWYDREISEETAGASIKACTEENIKEIFFTMWGDDGAYANFNSALAGLVYTSELIWKQKINNRNLSATFNVLCESDYNHFIQISDILNFKPKDEIKHKVEHYSPLPASIVWDDPLLGIFFTQQALKTPGIWTEAFKHYQKGLKKTEKFQTEGPLKKDIEHAVLLIQFIYEKIVLRRILLNAYSNNDKNKMNSLIPHIEKCIQLLDKFEKSETALWLETSKPFGIEVLQYRFSGQIRRFKYLKNVVMDFAAGKIDYIQELEPQIKHALISPLTKFNQVYSACSDHTN